MFAKIRSYFSDKQHNFNNESICGVCLYSAGGYVCINAGVYVYLVSFICIHDTFKTKQLSPL